MPNYLMTDARIHSFDYELNVGDNVDVHWNHYLCPGVVLKNSVSVVMEVVCKEWHCVDERGDVYVFDEWDEDLVPGGVLCLLGDDGEYDVVISDVKECVF